MNPPSRTDLIDRTFLQTWETMAFMFGEVTEASPLPAAIAAATPVLAEIRFSGHRSGRMSIFLPLDLAREIASNLLGLEPGEDQAEDQSTDAVKELLNVTCGRLLTALEGEHAPFQLSIPSVVTGVSADRLKSTSGRAAHGYRVEGHPVVLVFEMDGEA